MRDNELCFCGSGKIVKYCHPDINEKSLVAYILALYNNIDARYSRSNSVCKRGCFNCCSDNFMISFSEYLTIAQSIFSHARSECRVKDEWWSTISGNDKLDGYCIFIDQKFFTCKIYTIRPLICRNYGATVQDTYFKLCDPSSKQDESSLCAPVKAILEDHAEHQDIASLLGLVNTEEYDAIVNKDKPVFCQYCGAKNDKVKSRCVNCNALLKN